MDTWQDIARLGKKIISAGLTSSRFGNISFKLGDKIVITSTGSMLDELDQNKIIEVDLKGPCPQDVIASTETCVHRAIYQNTPSLAIIHTHSPYAVALSLIESDAVKPIDGEGLQFLGSMPIVSGEFGTDLLASNVSSALKTHRASIARGHGVFATGESLAEAYISACMAEHSSEIVYLTKIMKFIIQKN
jgi:L-fuculose-phosphate aldolase